MQSGETRVLGAVTDIECSPGALVFAVRTPTDSLRLSAAALKDVQFITYRDQPPGDVVCGPQDNATHALITYRAAQTSSGTTNLDGRAVAIELVPDDYAPQ